ncbi:hypothetical protein PFISCL1PPCAC_21585, partial [Pristionchus fissidentatus]
LPRVRRVARLHARKRRPAVRCLVLPTLVAVGLQIGGVFSGIRFGRLDLAQTLLRAVNHLYSLATVSAGGGVRRIGGGDRSWWSNLGRATVHLGGGSSDHDGRGRGRFFLLATTTAQTPNEHQDDDEQHESAQSTSNVQPGAAECARPRHFILFLLLAHTANLHRPRGVHVVVVAV